MFIYFTKNIFCDYENLMIDHKFDFIFYCYLKIVQLCVFPLLPEQNYIYFPLK